MQPQQPGSSRTSLQRDHFFQAPDSFIRAPLPGMTKGNAIVHIGPAAGARFTEYTAELEAGGKLGSTAAERFLFVLSGEVLWPGANLRQGGYAFVPQAEPQELVAVSAARLVVIEKAYQPLANYEPLPFSGTVEAVKPMPLAGDEDVMVQSLVPDNIAYDLAVNLMTFVPGAALSLVESHVMEHGLLMLDGGGIYRLGDCWYPTMAGDFIWMAPFCPQWFGAIGKSPAKYLIYKDWNRHPL